MEAGPGATTGTTTGGQRMVEGRGPTGEPDAAEDARDSLRDWSAPERGAKVAADRLAHGTVRLRPVAVARALDNLIANAVRYGTICRLSATVTSRAIHLCVEDNGPGIAPENHGKALKPFTTLDPARTRGTGSGAGLGLAIARDIARRHGGALQLGRSPDLGGLKAELVLVQ